MKLNKFITAVCSLTMAVSVFSVMSTVSAEEITPGFELKCVEVGENGDYAIIEAYVNGFSTVNAYTLMLASDDAVIADSEEAPLYTISSLSHEVSCFDGLFVDMAYQNKAAWPTVSSNELVSKFKISFAEPITEDVSLYVYGDGMWDNSMIEATLASTGEEVVLDTSNGSLAPASVTISLPKKAVTKAATPVATYTDGEDADVKTFKAYIAPADVTKTLTWTVSANGKSADPVPANIDVDYTGESDVVDSSGKSVQVFPPLALGDIL
jgi:hypothetical protein